MFKWFIRWREERKRNINIKVGHFIRFEERVRELENEIRDLKRVSQSIEKRRSFHVGYFMIFTLKESGTQMVWGDHGFAQSGDRCEFSVQPWAPITKIWVFSSGPCLLEMVRTNSRFFTENPAKLAFIDEEVGVGTRIFINVRHIQSQD